MYLAKVRQNSVYPFATRSRALLRSPALLRFAPLDVFSFSFRRGFAPSPYEGTSSLSKPILLSSGEAFDRGHCFARPRCCVPLPLMPFLSLFEGALPLHPTKGLRPFRNPFCCPLVDLFHRAIPMPHGHFAAYAFFFRQALSDTFCLLCVLIRQFHQAPHAMSFAKHIRW